MAAELEPALAGRAEELDWSGLETTILQLLPYDDNHEEEQDKTTDSGGGVI